MYLSTVLDDFSRHIIAWKLCINMRAEDVTDTLDLALKASGCDSATVLHKPKLLSDRDRCRSGRGRMAITARDRLRPWQSAEHFCAFRRHDEREQSGARCKAFQASGAIDPAMQRALGADLIALQANLGEFIEKLTTRLPFKADNTVHFARTTVSL